MNKWLSRIWEVPQKVLAHIIKWIVKAERFGRIDDATLYHWKLKSGLSLSTHIFLPKSVDPRTNAPYVLHEYGHTIQSHKLGPLYLLAVGLPSIIWNGCFKKYREKKGVSYYSVYPENWADKLGGVKRED